MPHNLTEKQKNVLNFIIENIQAKNSPPTIREIGKKFGFKSTGTPRQYLKTLIAKGYINYKRKLARGIEIMQKTNSIPVLGRISAGKWNEAIENPEENIDFDFLKNNNDLFSLKVKGDSMIGDGILEGDYVIVKKQNYAAPKDIVVAMLDNEAVIKRFFKTKQNIHLESSNPKYPTIVSKSITIIGKVITVLRKY